tara:strand:+ start:206 stop:754 length:549 start_codon:yes stop_codon:yes gene_type:complete
MKSISQIKIVNDDVLTYRGIKVSKVTYKDIVELVSEQAMHRQSSLSTHEMFSAKAMVAFVLKFGDGQAIRNAVLNAVALYECHTVVSYIKSATPRKSIEVIFGNDERPFAFLSDEEFSGDILEFLYGASYLTEKSQVVDFINKTRSVYKIKPLLNIIGVSFTDALQWPEITDSAKRRLLESL